MDAISTKLKELKEQYGPESYGVLSPQAYQVLWTLGRRFLNVHGSPNYMHSAICALQRAASKKICLGSASCDPGQLDKTKLLVVWGANPENSAINQGKPIDRVKAIENGLQVIDIRPMMDPLGAKADIWVPIRPGTDGALALAILHVIIGEDLYDHDFTANWCSGFDQLAQHVQQYTPEWAANITGLPVDQIYQIARMMGTTKPMGILYGNGIGDQQNDGNWTCISICLIEAITGNLDIAGGGGASMTMPPSLIKTNKFDILTDRLPASPEDEEKGYYAGMAKLVAPETPRWYQNPKTWESGPNSAYFKALMSALSQSGSVPAARYSGPGEQPVRRDPPAQEDCRSAQKARILLRARHALEHVLRLRRLRPSGMHALRVLAAVRDEEHRGRHVHRHQPADCGAAGRIPLRLAVLSRPGGRDGLRRRLLERRHGRVPARAA